MNREGSKCLDCEYMYSRVDPSTHITVQRLEDMASQHAQPCGLKAVRNGGTGAYGGLTEQPSSGAPCTVWDPEQLSKVPLTATCLLQYHLTLHIQGGQASQRHACTNVSLHIARCPSEFLSLRFVYMSSQLHCI